MAHLSRRIKRNIREGQTGKRSAKLTPKERMLKTWKRAEEDVKKAKQEE